MLLLKAQQLKSPRLRGLHSQLEKNSRDRQASLLALAHSMSNKTANQSTPLLIAKEMVAGFRGNLLMNSQCRKNHQRQDSADSPDRNLATNLATAFSRVTWTRCAKRVRELAVPVPDVRKMLPVAVQTEARNNHIRGATRPKGKARRADDGLSKRNAT